jgi:hypothetical protein
MLLPEGTRKEASPPVEEGHEVHDTDEWQNVQVDLAHNLLVVDITSVLHRGYDTHCRRRREGGTRLFGVGAMQRRGRHPFRFFIPVPWCDDQKRL